MSSKRKYLAKMREWKEVKWYPKSRFNGSEPREKTIFHSPGEAKMTFRTLRSIIAPPLENHVEPILARQRVTCVHLLPLTVKHDKTNFFQFQRISNKASICKVKTCGNTNLTYINPDKCIEIFKTMSNPK